MMACVIGYIAASAPNEEHEADPCIPPTTARGYRSRLRGREDTMGRGSAPSGGALFHSLSAQTNGYPPPSCRTEWSDDPASRAETVSGWACCSGYRIALRLCGMTAEGASGESAALKKLIPLLKTCCIIIFRLTHSGNWGNVLRFGVGWTGLLGEVTYHPAGSWRFPFRQQC